MTRLQGGVSKAQGLPTSISDALNGLLYHEAIRNLNWSRDYLWYVELDDVPNPFQRTGVIGFPATDITYSLNDGESFQWSGAIEEFAVPKSKRLCDITISFVDDEQQTLLTFFERWYNNIYNNNIGVLPLNEGCKTLSLYSLKSTRNKLQRKIYEYKVESDSNITKSNLGAKGIMKNSKGYKTVDCREFKVYPDGPLQEQLTYSGAGQPKAYNVRLVIVDYLNADYGDPAFHQSTFEDLNNAVGSDFLSKIADYI